MQLIERCALRACKQIGRSPPCVRASCRSMRARIAEQSLGLDHLGDCRWYELFPRGSPRSIRATLRSSADGRSKIAMRLPPFQRCGEIVRPHWSAPAQANDAMTTGTVEEEIQGKRREEEDNHAHT